MQLSCLPVSFYNDIVSGHMTVPDWARMGADIGLDAIDLSIALIPERSTAALARLRHDIEASGMGVTMLTTYPDFCHPDASQRKQELALELQAVEVAAALGAKYVRVTAGQSHPGIEREAGIAWAVEGLTRLIEETRGSGLRMVFENHGKPFCWSYPDLSASAVVFLEIVRQTAGIDLGVNFDTANATAYTEDPVGLLAQVVDRVLTVHAADTARRGALDMVVLGTGIVPFHTLFRQLRQAGFDGWICMEEGSNKGRDGVEASARFVRQAWDAARQ